jgi:hypothetical protein
MAYTNVWSKLAPLGSQAANLIDDDFRNLKLDISERFTTIFGTADLDGQDPVVATKLDFFNTASPKIKGGTVDLHFRNNADTNDNIVITDAGLVTLRNSLEMTIGGALIYIKLSSNGGSGVDWRIESRTDGKLVLRSVTGGADALVLNSGTLITPWACNFQNGVTITSGGINSSGGCNFDLGDYTFQCGTTHNVIADVTGAAIKGGFRLRRTGVIKAHIGLDASDSICFINAAENTAIFTVDNGGNATSAGNFAINGVNLFFNNGGPQKIRATSAVNIAFRNSADSADNILITDAGIVSIRSTLNALSGITSTGSITINIASGTALISNTTTNAAADVNQWIFQRGSVNKWRIGTNINGTNTDEFNIYNDATSTAPFRITNGAQLLFSSPTGTPTAIFDRNDAAAVNTLICLARQTVIKARIGLSAADDFIVTDSTGATANTTITSGGIVNARVGFQIGAAAANGNYLRGNGTNFVSSAIQPGDLPAAISCRAYKSGGVQTLTPASTFAAVSFNAEDFDTNTIHDNATNNTRFVAPNTGKYRIVGHITFAGVAANVVIEVRKNGVATALADSSVATVGTTAGTIEVNVTLSLSATDYIEIYAKSDVNNHQILDNLERTYAEMTFIGA